MSHRRNFLAAASGAIAAPWWVAPSALAQPAMPKQTLCVFTKPFNSLSFDELADKVAEMGFHGIEAPIRAGGHIEPPEVEDRLPKLVEALGKRGLEITVLTSDLNDASDPLTTRVLRTAASLGIKRYRMQYFKYGKDISPIDQIRQWKPQLKELAALNRELGILGLYQNHAGRNYMGASLWDLNMVLESISPKEIAVAYDIRHAAAEAGMSWPIAFQMIRPRIDTVYVKDFAWGEDKRPANVPLGTGHVDASFFEMLRKTGFDGPISLHEEYIDHRKPELVPEHLAAIRKDLKTLKGLLAVGR